MIATTDQVQQWLFRQSAEFFGRTDPPRSVAISRDGTALIASIRFGEEIVRLVVKPMSQNQELSPVELFRVHTHLVSKSHRLAENLPSLFGYNGDNSWIAMEFIGGPTLLNILISAKRQSSHDGYCNETLLKRCAVDLAEFHEFGPTDFGFAEATRSNESYIEGCFKFFAEPEMRKHFVLARKTFETVVSRLSETYLRRVGSRLIPVDCQPKNVLVPDSERIRFIDLDFIIAPPAMSAAFFLAALDRQGMRCILPATMRRIALWKQVFTRAYVGHVAPSIAEDLVIFYPFALAQTMCRHVKRPWLSSYLAKRYAWQMTSFLNCVLTSHTNDVSYVMEHAFSQSE